MYYLCGHACVVAIAALKRKKVLENELEKLQGTKFQLEMHANTLESANLNRSTMIAMKTAADALKKIHGDLYSSSATFPGYMRSYLGV